MVCEETCIPGRANVSLKLPIGKSTATAMNPSQAAYQIERWRGRLPMTTAPYQWLVEMQSTPDADENNALRVTCIIRGSDLQLGQILDWFPAAARNFAVKEVSVEKSAGRLTAGFVFKSFAGPIKAGERLESLLIYQDAKGVRRGSTLVPTFN
jgi:DsbC/DsbD-like thiol-disulfide interchange protein